MATPIQTSIQPPQNGISPSPVQLALAMAIVKHKPANMSIKDHILQIRQYIKTHQGSTQPVLEDKFFDSVAFWQQAYEKSEAEQSKLLDRIYELEMRNEGLLAKVKFGRDAGAMGDMVEVGKRKGSDVTNSGTAKKRTKTQGPTASNGLLDTVGDGLGRVGCLDEVTASFMRRFYILQKALQKRANCPNIVLAAVGLCMTAESEVLRVVGGRRTGTGPPKPALPQIEQHDLTAVIYGVECAFQLLLQALGKLSSTENAVHDVGQVTYHLVCLYDAIMKTLQNYCQAKVQQDSEKKKLNPDSTKKKPALKLKRGQTGRITETPSKPEEEVATQITHLLGKMALSLKTTCIWHQDLMKGFLFILLTRVGKITCLFVFQGMLRPDLYIDPATLPLPEGLNGADTSDTSLLAARMEAKYLIWLLEGTMTLLNPGSSSSDATNHKEFVSKIKERLHDTIFQAVFGTDDPLFQNPLGRPVPPAVLELDNLQDPPVPEIPTSDWFLQELWRLLGQEIMAKERRKA